MRVRSLAIRSITLSLALTANLASAQNATEQIIQVPVIPGYDPIPVTIPHPFPDGATISSVAESSSLGVRNVDVSMQETISTSGGTIIKAVFSNGLMLVGCLNGATVPNYGIGSGQAKVINPATEMVVGGGTVAVTSNIVRLSASESLVSIGQLTHVASNFTHAYYLGAIGPEALEMFPGSFVSIGTAPLMSALPNVIRTNRFWPIKWDPRWTVEVPRVTPFPPKPGDITGDGRNDWDCNGDTWIAPLGDVYVDTWIADNGAAGASNDDSLVTVIGHDTNGNGKLDANEVTAIIGECREVPGMNNVYIEKLDGVYYVHHINWDDENRNERIDPGEDVWHYIYNTSTGVLKIYDKNGDLVYMGPPSGSPNQVPPYDPWDWWYN